MYINELLKYKHIEQGITLEEQEDIVILCKNKIPQKIFSSVGTNQEEILKEVDKLLE